MTQYGLLPGDFPSSSTSSNIKIPAGLQIRRWEAIDAGKYIPSEYLDAVHARKAERARVREECVRLLKEMDDVEAHDLVKVDAKERKTQESKVVERGRVEVRLFYLRRRQCLRYSNRLVCLSPEQAGRGPPPPRTQGEAPRRSKSRR